jgi:hypothetical protein
LFYSWSSDAGNGVWGWVMAFYRKSVFADDLVLLAKEEVVLQGVFERLIETGR